MPNLLYNSNYIPNILFLCENLNLCHLADGQLTADYVDATYDTTLFCLNFLITKLQKRSRFRHFNKTTSLWIFFNAFSLHKLVKGDSETKNR